MTGDGLIYVPQYLVSSEFCRDDGLSSVSLKDADLVYDCKLGGHIADGTFSKVFDCEFGSRAAAAKVCTPLCLSMRHSDLAGMCSQIYPCSQMSLKDFSKMLRELRILPYLRHENVIEFFGYVIKPKEVRYG